MMTIVDSSHSRDPSRIFHSDHFCHGVVCAMGKPQWRGRP